MLGEISMPEEKAIAIQGETIFFNEKFQGNGRTCGTCHLESDSFGLGAETVANLPDSDPLFIHESDINKIEVNSMGSVNPNGTGSQPSDFRLGDVITGSFGGEAKVIAGSGSTYYIVGGKELDIVNNELTDSSGNQGTIVTFQWGNLNGERSNRNFGLDSSLHLRGGRALIVANVDGFNQPAMLRGVPSLLASEFGGGIGQSRTFLPNGTESNRREFTKNTVEQHMTINLDRVNDRDFRQPTLDEINAMNEFIRSLTPFPWSEIRNSEPSNRPDIILVKDNAHTEAQQRGALLYKRRCQTCHDEATGNTFSSLNTGVSRREINAQEGLPTEQRPGREINSRPFFGPHLIGLKDSAPYFHDNSSPTLEDVVLFYVPDMLVPDTQALATFLKNIRHLPYSVSDQVLDMGFKHLDDGPSTAKTFTFTNVSDQQLRVSNIRLFGQRLYGDNDESARLARVLETYYNFVDDFSYSHDAPTDGFLQPNETIEFEVIFDPSEEFENFLLGTAQAAIEFDVLHKGESFRAGAMLEGDRGNILDIDKDGFDWQNDNCIETYNPSQSNVDGDYYGDVCDDNADNDNWINVSDNCPLVVNNSQLDFDSDGQGDRCDLDDDDDGIEDAWEVINALNPKDPSDAILDSDEDGFTNLVEFKYDSDPNKKDTDIDLNGVPDSIDLRRKIRKVLPGIIYLLK